VFSRSVWRWFIPSAVRLRADRWRRREAGDDLWRYRRKPASASCGAGSAALGRCSGEQRRLGSSTSAACREPEQSRLPLRPAHSANTLNSASSESFAHAARTGPGHDSSTPTRSRNSSPVTKPERRSFSFRGCIRRPMGHPPGPTTCTAVRGAPPLRKKVVSSQRTTKARRSHSLPLLTYSAPGGLRQDPGRAAESAAGPRTDVDMGPRRACVVVDGRGTR
jgi:hypothetical protein